MVTIMHKAPELRSDSYNTDTFFDYMTVFMFVFNALLLGNSGFASDKKTIELCSSSAKYNICSFPSLSAPLGS